ncbi:hypothetical protein FNV43_RR27340 [Rhamnella rubrinervis]|uniref:Uncharacterized protein n=1 Tax=Rhamnella rubrinervis TaxID=2594499 RepID=A0A8K0DRM0_9ROSA|nr:hypothetical protein FNV43_RR27340 [Rhamnella rubrinervis]
MPMTFFVVELTIRPFNPPLSLAAEVLGWEVQTCSDTMIFKVKLNAIVVLGKWLQFLHKACSNVCLEEISSVVSSNAFSIEEWISKFGEASPIFDDLQSCLSTQQGEMFPFKMLLYDAKIPPLIFNIQRFHANTEQTKDISEHSVGFLLKLLEDLKKLDDCVTIVHDLKLKSFADFQKAYEIGSEHILTMVELIRNVSDCNEYHDITITSARVTTKQDVAKNKLSTVMYEEEKECISGNLEAARDHSNIIDTFWEDYFGEVALIENKAHETFLNQYMVGCSVILPYRMVKMKPRTMKKIVLPRAMPTDALVEEFRENHSYESVDGKELKPSLIPHSPLA